MSNPAVDIVVHADASVPYLATDVRAAVDRLRGRGADPLDVFRSGSWFATASVRGEIVGCARALPSCRTTTPGLRALGPDRYDEWLAGGLELTEVVVGADVRSRGVGASLLAAVLTPARGRRAWTQTGRADRSSWLRRRGWTTVARDHRTGSTVLLDPRHPAARDGLPVWRVA